MVSRSIFWVAIWDVNKVVVWFSNRIAIAWHLVALNFSMYGENPLIEFIKSNERPIERSCVFHLKFKLNFYQH